MSIVPRHRQEKYCFTYCGARCDCQAGEPMIDRMRREQFEADQRLFEKVNRTGGIWGFSPRSDRIGP